MTNRGDHNLMFIILSSEALLNKVNEKKGKNCMNELFSKIGSGNPTENFTFEG